MEQNKLKLNEESTEILQAFYPSLYWELPFWPLKLGPKPKFAYCIKTLGVKIDTDLSSTEQVNAIVKISFFPITFNMNDH